MNTDKKEKKDFPLRRTRIAASRTRYKCTLCYRGNGGTAYRSAVNTPYDADTAAYAACRYIRHSPTVKDCLISEAVHLGLEVHKVFPHYRTLKTSARDLELPGGTATVFITVSAGTLTVTGVKVSR